MARVRVEKELSVRTWEEANLVLAEIGELQRAIKKREIRQDEECAEAKLRAELDIAPMQDKIKALGADLKAFTDRHLDDLYGKKTKQLRFGKLGYRLSTKAWLPKSREALEKIIAALRKHGMEKCIITPPESINRDILKTYPEAKVLAVGAKLIAKDAFWYEVDTKPGEVENE